MFVTLVGISVLHFWEFFFVTLVGNFITLVGPTDPGEQRSENFAGFWKIYLIGTTKPTYEYPTSYPI